MDAETKEILAEICELLRVEIMRATAVDNSMVALARAILESESPLREKYAVHWDRIIGLAQGAVPPQTSDAFERLGALIEQLKA